MTLPSDSSRTGDDPFEELGKIDFTRLERAAAGDGEMEVPSKPASTTIGPDEQATGSTDSSPFAAPEPEQTREEVQPSIDVAPDGLTAFYSAAPEAVRPATMERLEQLVSAAHVVYGIDESALRSILDRSGADVDYAIAHGDPARPGRDATVAYAFDFAPKPGVIKEDGSIDFHERGTIVGVKRGQLLATKVDPTPGQAGRDVLGRTIRAENGKDQELVAGQNVRTEREGEETRFLSEVDGSVVLKGKALQVLTIHRVGGDVSFLTGNIDFGGDVMIGGSVGAGFSVKAAGSITIGGGVERNTVVSALGNIGVARGIVGRGIEVTSGGSVTAKFIQDATVVARQDIVVGSYVFNASLRAGGRVICHGRGLSRTHQRSTGTIAGGFVFAALGIETHSLGSEYAKSTSVVVGIGKETLDELDKLQKALEACESGLLKIVRTLGLENLSVESVKLLIQRSPESRREAVVALIKKAAELRQTRDHLILERKQYEDTMEASARDAFVQVHQTVFEGVHIRVGRANLEVPSSMANARFFANAEDGSVQWVGRKLKQESET